MKRIVGYFFKDKVDLAMFIAIPTLIVGYLISKEVYLLMASAMFGWFWMTFAIIRMGMFRDKLEK